VGDDCNCIGFIFVVYNTYTLRLFLSSQTECMEYMLMGRTHIKFAQLSHF
jgi:hypothetical protein